MLNKTHMINCFKIKFFFLFNVNINIWSTTWSQVIKRFENMVHEWNFQSGIDSILPSSCHFK